MVGVLLLGSGNAILFGYLVLLIILIIGVEIAVKVVILSLAAQASLAGVYVPLQVLELFTVVFTLLDHRLDLFGAQKVEELEHADLPVLNLAEQGEGEDADEGDHSDRDEADQVHEELRLVRGLDRVRLDQALLQKAQRVERGHTVIIEVEEGAEQASHLSLRGVWHIIARLQPLDGLINV